MALFRVRWRVGKQSATETLLPLVKASLASVHLRPLADGELLSRYVVNRDEGAFVELVRRLGPMVLGVCRRILGHDTDDTFQVVFMVLARKAESVRPTSQVAAWLYGVANITARKTLNERLRQRQHERPIEAATEPAFESINSESDLFELLDRELSKLPVRYRLPIILCELRELTVAQAAVELRWPVGTVASRLSRGRKLLAQRLQQRGIASLAILGLGAEQALGRVPLRLMSQVAEKVLSRSFADQGASLPLMNEVLQAMMWNKIRTFVVAAAAPMLLVPVLGVTGFAVLQPGVAAPIPKGLAATAADPLDRIRLENVGRLLKNEAVLKDLGLTDEAKKELEAIRQGEMERLKAERMERLKNVIQQARQRGAVAAPALPAIAGNVVVNNVQFDGMVESTKLDEELLKKLKPEQIRRLKQVVIQSRGPKVLLDRHVIRALSLTAEQEDKIDALLPRRSAFEAGAIQVAGVGVAEGAAQKASEKIDAQWADVLKVLSADQRKNWDKLIGKTIPTLDLQAVVTIREEGVNVFPPAIRIAPIPAPALPVAPLVPAKP
jgi:RNA polymerase sigma factor (sigma-70 family)